jgi:hypothetical protein
MHQYEITIKLLAQDDWEVDRWLTTLHDISKPSIELETSYIKHSAEDREK